MVNNVIDGDNTALPDEVYRSLIKRLDGACQKVIENTGIDQESREKAANQAGLYYMTVNAIVSQSGGMLPKSALPIIEAVNEFIDIVNHFCDDNKSAPTAN